jgi:hypothetical protein
MPNRYGRYHGLLLRLARRAAPDGAWKSKLREILALFDEDCGSLDPAAAGHLRAELAAQLESEILRFSDAEAQAVLAFAIKHFDAVER